MGITLFLFIQAAVALWGIRWVIQVRSKCFPEYKSSWLAQLAGLSLVVIGTLGIGGLNLTQGSIAGSILFLTVYVAGIFLFLAGLSRWLAPVLEAAREQHYTLRRLVFLKNLRQKLNNEKSLQQISQTALAEFLETLPFRA